MTVGAPNQVAAGQSAYVNDNQRQPPTTTDYQRLPPTATDCHRGSQRFAPNV